MDRIFARFEDGFVKELLYIEQFPGDVVFSRPTYYHFGPHDTIQVYPKLIIGSSTVVYQAEEAKLS